MGFKSLLSRGKNLESEEWISLFGELIKNEENEDVAVVLMEFAGALLWMLLTMVVFLSFIQSVLGY